MSRYHPQTLICVAVAADRQAGPTNGSDGSRKEGSNLKLHFNRKESHHFKIALDSLMMSRMCSAMSRTRIDGRGI